MLPPARSHPWSFLGLAYGISWSIAGVGIALGVSTARPIAYMAMAGSFMFGPAIAAMLQQRLLDRAPWRALGMGLQPVRWPFMAATALAGMAIVPLCLLLARVLGDACAIDTVGHVSVTQERLMDTLHEQLRATGRPPGQVDRLLGEHHLPGGVILGGLLLVALFAACTFNLPAMWGEELGWRGYLYQATASWMPVRRILFTGVAWGLWHAPLVAVGHNYPGRPVLGIALMTVFTTLLAVLFDWSRTRTQSVWGPCLLHGLINGSAGAFALFSWGGHDLVASPVGVIGFLAIIGLCVLVLALDPGYRRYIFQAGDRSSHASGVA